MFSRLSSVSRFSYTSIRSFSSSPPPRSLFSRFSFILLGSLIGSAAYIYAYPSALSPSQRDLLTSLLSHIPSFSSAAKVRPVFSWESLEVLLREFQAKETEEIQAWNADNKRKNEEITKNSLLKRYQQLAQEVKLLTESTGAEIQQRIKGKEKEVRTALIERVQQENEEFFSYLTNEIQLIEDRIKGEELSDMKEQSEESKENALRLVKHEAQKRLQVELNRLEASVALRGSEALKQQQNNLSSLIEEEKAKREGWISQLQDSIGVFDQAFNDLVQFEFFSRRVHQLSLSMIALEELIPKGEFSSEWRILASCGSSDPIIQSALDSVPQQVAQKGVKTIKMLQEEFARLERPLRTAAYYHSFHHPEWPTASRLVARCFASLTISDRIPTEGDSEQEKLARASYWLLQKGNLAKTLQEIDSLKPENQTLLSDWLQGAKDRAIVEQAMETVKARILTLSLKFGADPIEL
jgi:hypothetical protein